MSTTSSAPMKSAKKAGKKTSRNSKGLQKAVRDIENDREFKAYVYQHLADLQPLLGNETQVAVVIEQEAKNEYKLTLVTTLGDLRVEAEGRDKNPYSAFAGAKLNLTHQLDEWQNATIDSNEREMQIRGLLDGSLLIH